MDQQITCSACGHAFKVSAKALWIICPQCGHSLDATGEHRQVDQEDLADDDPTRVALTDSEQEDAPELGDLDTLFDDEEATIDGTDGVTIGDRPSDRLAAVTRPNDPDATPDPQLTGETTGLGEAITAVDDSAERDLLVTSPDLALPTLDLDSELVVANDQAIGDQTIADDEAIGDQTIADDEAIEDQTIADDDAPEAPTLETPQLAPPRPNKLGSGGQLGRIALRKVPASQARRSARPAPPPPPAPPRPPPAPAAPTTEPPTDPFADPGFADGPLLDADGGVTRIRTEMESQQDESTNPSSTRPPPLPPRPATPKPKPPQQRRITLPPSPPAPLSPVGTGHDLPERPPPAAPNAAAAAASTGPFAAGSRREALKVRTAATARAKRPSNVTLSPEPFAPPPAVVPDLGVASVRAAPPAPGLQQRQAALSSAIEEALEDEVTQSARLPGPQLGRLQGQVPDVPERDTAVLTEATPAPYAANLSSHSGIEVFVPDAPIEERARRQEGQKRAKRPPTGAAPIQQLAPITRQPHLAPRGGVAVRQGARQIKQTKKVILIVGAIALAGVAALALL